MSKNIYERITTYENENFKIRHIMKDKDSEPLRMVYSDTKALPLFNSDNCHGDLFFYDTKEKMDRALDFWEESYRNKFFVRWAVVDKRTDTAIGTIELFHRDAEDDFTNCGLLRLDLLSAFEREEAITSILQLIIDDVYESFQCMKIATKANALAVQRRAALLKLGFIRADSKLCGHDGTQYGDYYIRYPIEER